MKLISGHFLTKCCGTFPRAADFTPSTVTNGDRNHSVNKPAGELTGGSKSRERAFFFFPLFFLIEKLTACKMCNGSGASV